jgi:hypothetical protein
MHGKVEGLQIAVKDGALNTMEQVGYYSNVSYIGFLFPSDHAFSP